MATPNGSAAAPIAVGTVNGSLVEADGAPPPTTEAEFRIGPAPASEVTSARIFTTKTSPTLTGDSSTQRSGAPLPVHASSLCASKSSPAISTTRTPGGRLSEIVTSGSVAVALPTFVTVNSYPSAASPTRKLVGRASDEIAHAAEPDVTASAWGIPVGAHPSTTTAKPSAQIHFPNRMAISSPSQLCARAPSDASASCLPAFCWQATYSW